MAGSSENCRSSELQCVGRLEIDKPKPVGFLCGTLPVPTDKAFHNNGFHTFSSDQLVPSPSSSSQTIAGPRYRMLPTETDLNAPLAALHSSSRPPTGDLQWEGSGTTQNLARKCEALAVLGLSEYGDEIDVVAPADIMKQIFKMPYSKARLSIAVHRIGQTLILNIGPEIEEEEKLVRRHSSQSKHADQSLFLNFAMHSVRAEACDCPPGHAASEEQSNSTVLPGDFEGSSGSFLPSDRDVRGSRTYLGENESGNQKKGLNCQSKYSEVDWRKYWDKKHSKKDKRDDTVKKASQVKEKMRCSVQESEKHRRGGSNGFQRVLFWQFHNFRMLLGSDLLLFSNEKYVAVSLHLWDVMRQVTPLTWLEAWLDNIMASAPELAICYHRNGVVQGYELLKTDDIFLLKGISADGVPAFHPHVVQQNGLSVLRFLQNNCEQDPGVYWLYKNAGEDVIQLFDLSVIPKSHSPEDLGDSSSSLPSVLHKGRRDSFFSLGLLLYRVAHRLSLSMVSNNKAKCAKLFQKCLNFLDEQDHLVVRAFAHEQFARLILKYYEDLDLTSESVRVESEVVVIEAKDEESGSTIVSGSVSEDKPLFQVVEDPASREEVKILEHSTSILETCASGNSSALGVVEVGCSEVAAKCPRGDDSQALQMSTAPHMVHTVADPISSKLAAVHHVSQAIKSLRWKRQLQNSEEEVIENGNSMSDKLSPVPFSLCACGDADCIEVCDIREWLPKSRMDHKLWKLVLLLGESYLALGQAYLEAGQLHQALKIVELACSVYGSMPQHLEDDALISSVGSFSSCQSKFDNKSGKTMSSLNDPRESDLCSPGDGFDVDQFRVTYVFWAKAWVLVGDIYVQILLKSKEEATLPERNVCTSEMRMPSEVEREVKRLKKKLGQFKQNCSTCFLLNCSCRSDRASSGNSASSSSTNVHTLSYGRKHSKKSNAKNSLHSSLANQEDVHRLQEVENASGTDRRSLSQRDESLTQSSTNSDIRRSDETFEISSMEPTAEAESQQSDVEAVKQQGGGIFRFVKCPTAGDAKSNLSAVISCYDAAEKALSGFSSASSELQSVLKKKGWACNELGRMWLESKDLDKAEVAFADAISAFKKVSDHINIILINCNLGHGRRALAEEIVSKIENLKMHALFQNAHKTSLENAKLEYSESLRYYGAARSELTAVEEGACSVTIPSSLRNEVYTQFAHTYLRLGMLLAREDTSAKIYDSGALDRLLMGHVNPHDKRVRGELRKRDISANDAIREALSMYELLGELRKQEAAYAYFQLACYHRDFCLKFMNQIKLSSSENNVLQKVKQYASLAERNWHKSIEFYGPKTHSVMYLTILIEQSTLLLKLSDAFHLTTMLESALGHLLEGRRVLEEPAIDLSNNAHAEINTKLWSHLQALLKRMLHIALSGSTSKSSVAPQSPSPSSKSGDVEKLKKLYGLALKSSDLSQLQAMHELWIS
ncbi:hypothetical protein Syun_003054 [Stephania yunnanensis]|uniref:EDRF1 N-terminal domain-containing protein n=1 Tax=Stephania yunnanensis TaxID=152371 RepID=A0AAP0L258_9MAGN